MAPQTPNTYARDRPALRIPAALERPSGTFERNTAATATVLTAPPWIRLTPIATDSGMPSMSAPIASASPEPGLPDSDGCEWDRFRRFAPRRFTITVAAV